MSEISAAFTRHTPAGSRRTAQAFEKAKTGRVIRLALPACMSQGVTNEQESDYLRMINEGTRPSVAYAFAKATWGCQAFGPRTQGFAQPRYAACLIVFLTDLTVFFNAVFFAGGAVSVFLAGRRFTPSRFFSLNSHRSSIPHCVHLGARATQIYRPCRISQ